MYTSAGRQIYKFISAGRYTCTVHIGQASRKASIQVYFGRQAGMQVYMHIGRQAGRQAHKNTSASRQEGRFAKVHIGRQAGRKAGIHVYIGRKAYTLAGRPTGIL
jgi:hypothetical protein